MRKSLVHVFACAGLIVSGNAATQTIDRVKLTDNDMSCQQIYAESQQMDTAMQLSASSAPAPAPAAAAAAAIPVAPNAFAGVTNPVGNNLTLAQMHAPTAATMTQQGVPAHMQQQIANNMAAAQVGQYRPATTSQAQAVAQAGGLASMFGALAGNIAARPAPAAAQLSPSPQPAGNTLAAQAKARKDHLTGLFLSRGCKMSELQR